MEWVERLESICSCSSFEVRAQELMAAANDAKIARDKVRGKVFLGNRENSSPESIESYQESFEFNQLWFSLSFVVRIDFTCPGNQRSLGSASGCGSSQIRKNPGKLNDWSCGYMSSEDQDNHVFCIPVYGIVPRQILFADRDESSIELSLCVFLRICQQCAIAYAQAALRAADYAKEQAWSTVFRKVERDKVFGCGSVCKADQVFQVADREAFRIFR